MRLLGAIAVLATLEAGVARAAVGVESDSACPSADAVRRELDALGGRDAPRAVAMMVRNHGDRLTVEFSWPGDSQSETRDVAVESDCQARAQAAAVVIASWLGMLPDATLLSTPLGAPPEEIHDSKIVPREPDKTPPVEPPPASPSTDAPARPSAAGPAVADTALPARPARRSWLGVGLGGSAGGGVVPGLRVELTRARAGTGFELGWMVSALASMPRSKSLDGGTSSWIRPAVGLAGMAMWGGSRVQLAADLGPLVGLTVAWGSGYPTSETDTSVTWGFTGGLRLQMIVYSSRAWLELRVIDWLRRESLQHEVVPSGPSGSASLPSVEGLLSLGWSFGV